MTMFLLWLKKYWHWIALGVGIVLLGIYLRQDFINDRALDTLLDNMRQTSQEHLKEIKRLEEINKRKEKQLKNLNEKYKQQIEELEEEYNSDLKKIEKDTGKDRKKIVKEAYRDPTTLTKKVEQVFGIPYYKPGEDE